MNKTITWKSDNGDVLTFDLVTLVMLAQSVQLERMDRELQNVVQKDLESFLKQIEDSQ